MVEDAAHDFLRDVPVDQPGAEGVAPLVRGEVDRLAVLVADVAARPASGRAPAGRWGCRSGGVPSMFLVGRGNSTGRACRPALRDARAVFADQLAEFLVDGTSASRFILWL